MRELPHRKIVDARHELSEEIVEVSLHVGTGILPHAQAAGGVLHEQREQPFAPAAASHELRNLAGELGEPEPAVRIVNPACMSVPSSCRKAAAPRGVA